MDFCAKHNCDFNICKPSHIQGYIAAEIAAEIAALREKNSAERKAEPIWSGVLQYFPDALAAVARVSKAGNNKHNPGQPLHWARSKSNDHLDCATRHTITPYKVDPESKEYHLAHATWRDLAALQLAEEKRLTSLGIETLSGLKGEE